MRDIGNGHTEHIDPAPYTANAVFVAIADVVARNGMRYMVKGLLLGYCTYNRGMSLTEWRGCDKTRL
ncbi:hypothetical protein BIW11_12237 [Tropilaelaps mercedesae]|uniref:Uncharacterized protein n=1 Tax=Tropilaelaps mercedesae TaxID=418985 RepID=A0A1V9X7A0_9ACAR|nr:hypothetical protein BIW11_12237 [Tropilaelaps mercedesae]